MAIQLPQSIRGRLFAFALAVAVPLLVVLVLAFLSNLRREHADARDLALRIARAYAGDVAEANVQSRALLRRMAERASAIDPRSEGCDALFAIVDFFPNYYNLVQFDTSGVLVCTATPQPSDTAVARVANGRIRARLRDQPLSRSAPSLLRIDEQWVKVSFRDVTFGGVTSGVLALVERFDLGVESYPSGTVITVLDADGTVLARSVDAASWVGRNVADTELGHEVTMEDEGRTEARGVDGELRQYGYAVVPGAGWRIVVGVPAGVAMATVRALIVQGVIAGIIAIAVVALLAHRMSRTIERPLAALSDAADTIAREGYGLRVPDSGPREIAALAQSFNMMVDQRARSEEALVESRVQLEALSKSLLEVQEEERGRISSEIHDRLGQLLTALKMDLGGLVKTVEPMSGDQRVLADRIRRELDETIAAVQRIASELRPPVLEDFGLVAAIEAEVRLFESRTGIECELSTGAEELRLEPESEVVAYRIVQEAMTNVARHSDATRVEIRMRVRDGELLVEVRDDGVGIPADRIVARESLGIAGMRERARRTGGRLEVEGLPGSGTIVSLRLPLARSKEGAA